MTSKISLVYEKTWNTGDLLCPENYLPSQNMQFSIPDADELSTKQLFYWFASFLRSLSYSERAIAVGAMEIVFNQDSDEKLQQWVCDQHDLTMNENLQEKFEEFKKNEEEVERICKMIDPMGMVHKTTHSQQEDNNA